MSAAADGHVSYIARNSPKLSSCCTNCRWSGCDLCTIHFLMWHWQPAATLQISVERRTATAPSCYRISRGNAIRKWSTYLNNATHGTTSANNNNLNEMASIIIIKRKHQSTKWEYIYIRAVAYAVMYMHRAQHDGSDGPRLCNCILPYAPHTACKNS